PYVVESEAARSLGKTRSPRAFDAILRAIDRPSQGDILQAGCVGGLEALRDPRGLEVIERFARYGAPALSRGAAIMALARLAKELPDRREWARDTLEPFLDDPWFRAQAAAAPALAVLGAGTGRRIAPRPARKRLVALAVLLSLLALTTVPTACSGPEERPKPEKDLSDPGVTGIDTGDPLQGEGLGPRDARKPRLE